MIRDTDPPPPPPPFQTLNQYGILEANKSRILALLSPTARKMYYTDDSHRAAMLGFRGKTKSTYVFRKRYRIHSQRVKSIVSSDELLVYNVKQGWKPLCDFSGCEIPNVAFPHKNIKGQIGKVPLAKTRIGGHRMKCEIQRTVFLISAAFVTVIVAIFLNICNTN